MQVSTIFQSQNEDENVKFSFFAQCEPLSVLIDVINKHYGIRNNVVDQFLQFHANDLMLSEWHKYTAALSIYETDKAAIEAENEANAENPEYKAKSLPTKPEWTDDNVAHIKADHVKNLPEVKAALSTKRKELRQKEFDAITVEVDGIVFDGDKPSRDNFENAMKVSDLTGQTETPWKLHDNTWATVTREQLEQAYIAASLEYQKIMAKWG